MKMILSHILLKKTKFLLLFAMGVFSMFFSNKIVGQTTLIDPLGDGGFENATSTLAANGWTAVNTTSIAWFVGTAAGSQSGTKAAFVGSDASTYIGSSAAVVKHFYRDIVIPVGATQVYLNYYLKMPIIDNTYDYFYIYTTTTANTPVSGTIPGAGYTQRIAYTTPALAGFTAMPQIDLTALAGTTVRLVFTYKTDAASPFANPAVDNISLTYIPGCTTPADPANPTAGAFGCNVTLTASGTAPVGETWYWQGTSCGTSTALGSAPATYSAATTDTYYIRSRTNVGGCWSAGCGTVIVNALDAPVIITSPESSYGCVGSPVTFTVIATGAGITYQWRKGGVNIAGATLDTYTIGSIVAGDAGNYDCVVTGTCGTATSAVGVLTVISAGLSGVRTVGTAGNYATLKLAFDAINANGLSGNLELQIISDITETAEASLNQWVDCNGNTGYAVTIYPTGATRTISGSIATSLITLNGADKVTFDGRLNQFGAANSLILSNTNTSGSTFKLINDASNNVIKYCTLKGVYSAAATNGVVWFSTASSTGNDNNSILYCNIQDGATTSTHGIYSVGTAGMDNNNNIISNNNIFNFWNTNYLSCGIYLSTGNNAWTISNNSFYQTTSRADWRFAGIYIVSATGTSYNIDGNYIGGGAPLCAGTAWTITGTTYNSLVYGIVMVCSNTGISTIQNNTIKNFNISMRIQADQDMAFCGILTDGRINIVENTIGDNSTGSITLYCRAGTTAAWTGWNLGIDKYGDGNLLKNKIGSITITGTVTSQLGFNAIQIGGSLINDVVISENTIGSATTTNSIQTSSGATPAATIGGIYFGTAGNYNTTVSNNTIANLNNGCTGTGAFIVGLYNEATNGKQIVIGNNIGNFTTASTRITDWSTVNLMSAITGIASINTSNGGHVISNNTIYSFSATAAAAVQIFGIMCHHNAANGTTISNNFIHSFSSTSNTAIQAGIKTFTGIATVDNNMIRLGVDGAGVSVSSSPVIYGIWQTSTSACLYNYNSIYLGGNDATGGGIYTYAFRRTAGSSSLYNNILFNNRTGGTGRHYAIVTNSTTVTSNYNDLYTSNAANLGSYNGGGTARTFVAWQTGTVQDANSRNEDPQFLAQDGTATTVKLHLNPASPEIGRGLANTVLTDIDNQVRKTGAGFPNGPTIGADEVLTSFGSSAYGIYSPAALGGEVVDCEIYATGGTSGGQGIKVADNADNNWANVGISSYQVITTDNIACMNTDISFNTVSGTPSWLFGNGSVPTSGVTSPIEVQYNSTGRKDIIENVKLYKDFMNITMPIPSPGSILGAPAGAGCPTTYSYTSSVAGSDGFTYAWSATVPGGCTATIASPTASTSNVTFINLTGVNQIFILSLQITTECCGPLTLIKRYITIYPSPPAPVVPLASFSLCTGGSQSFSVNPTNPAYSYEWYTASTGGTLLGTGASYTVNTVLSGATSYWVQATNSYGCSSQRTEVIVTGNDTPAPTVPATFICGSGDVTLTISSPDAGYTYTWYSGSCGGTILQSNTSTSFTTAITVTTTFYVSAIPPGCGESACAAVTATVNPLPNPIVWLGAIGGLNNWFNASNWSSGCVPTCASNVRIPNLGIDPDIGFNASANAACQNIDLEAGAVLSFSDTKAELDICGNMNHAGILTTNNFGLVKFMGSVAQTYTRTGTGDFHNVTIDNSAATPTLTIVNGNLVLDALGVFEFVTGKVVTGANNVIVNNTNIAAITSYSEISYVVGNLRRYLNATGSYDFPLGNINALELANVNITGGSTISYLTGNFSNPVDALGTGLPLSEVVLGLTYNYLGVVNVGGVNATTGNANGGVWTFTPNAGSATYNLTLYGRNFDNCLGYTPLKRTSGATPWTLNGTYGSSSNVANVITCSRTGLVGFSQFAIANSIFPLPIELLTFGANYNGASVDLVWVTQSEVNNNYFNVEKSINAIDFLEIGKVLSLADGGNSQSHLSYTFNDDKVSPGTYYYRLKQVDIDGEFMYSETASVIIGENGVFTIQPNPAKDQVEISYFCFSADNPTLRMFDDKSRLIIEKELSCNKGQNKVIMDIGNFSQGVYLITLSGKNGVERAKLIKQ